jgi:hypothetical protein
VVDVYTFHKLLWEVIWLWLMHIYFGIVLGDVGKLVGYGWCVVVAASSYLLDYIEMI